MAEDSNREQENNTSRERENSEIRERVYEAVIDAFNDKGLKFTMDDVAKRLGMSKKTLYQLFDDKEKLFLETIEYGFRQVKLSEQKILENPKLSIEEKIRRVIIVLPDKYRSVDYRKLFDLKEKYPDIYREVAKRIESDWEPTLMLLRQGMEEGVIRKVSLPVLKAIIEGSMEHFLTGDMLIREKITYEKALEQMIDIIMKGILSE